MRKKSYAVVDGAIEPHEPTRRETRAQRRRPAEDAEKLVTTLLELSEGELDLLPLDDALRVALRAARATTAHGARRRQLQYVMKILRQGDPEALAEALGDRQGVVQARDVHLQQLERWRTRLLTEGDEAVDAFVDAYPAADRQRLRNLVRQASRDPESEKARRARQQIFQLLRDVA